MCATDTYMKKMNCYSVAKPVTDDVFLTSRYTSR